MTYSSTMAMGRQNLTSRGRNSVSFRTSEKRLGPVSNTIILIVLACVLGLLYLTQVTKTNAYGYTINNLQEQQTKLASEHEDLTVASARLQSVSRFQNSASAQNLTPATPAGAVQ